MSWDNIQMTPVGTLSPFDFRGSKNLKKFDHFRKIKPHPYEKKQLV